MKRFFIILLVLLTLCACVPTPEQEFVVSKADDVVEIKLNATPRPVEAAPTVPAQSSPIAEPEQTEPTESPLLPQSFPDRWDMDEVELRENATLTVHADVLTRTDGLYPVYRTKEAPLTVEEAARYVSLLLPAPIEAYTVEPTKDDYKQEFKEYLESVAEQQAWVDAGRPDWGDRDETVISQEEIDEQTAWYQEQIQKAPDKLTTRKVSDYSDLKLNTQTAYTLSDGSKAAVSLYRDGFSVSKNCTGFGYTYYDYYYEEEARFGEPNAKLWQDVTLPLEDAEAILAAELKRLGLEDYDVVSATKANLFDAGETTKTKYVTQGWSFDLRKTYGGYPSIDVPYAPSQWLKYADGNEFFANKRVSPEEVTLFIDENGVQSLSFYHRKEVVTLRNPNVELLPFEEIQRLAVNAMSLCLPTERGQGRTIDYEIYRVLLTTYTLRERNEDTYYEMPCWILFFDGMYPMADEYREAERNAKNMSHDTLVLNAVDGSIVYTVRGY